MKKNFNKKKKNLNILLQTFAIGVTKNVNEDQLLEITGNSDKMWANIDSFDDFTAETASKIGNYICEKSCA